MRTLKVKAIVSSLIMALSCSLLANTMTWTDANEVVWTYSLTNKKTAILGGDDAWAISQSTVGAIEIPSKVGGTGGQYKVAKIGDEAFLRCTGLTSVTIPSTVTEIGAGAFEGCTGLDSLEIPEGVAAIGDWAFADCTSLQSISIPSTIESIGTGVLAESGKNGSLTVYVKSGEKERIKALIDASNEADWPNPTITYVVAGAIPEYVISFDANGGTCDTAGFVRHENAPLGQLPTPSRTDFSFAGWYTDADSGTQVDSETLVTDNAIYYAHWMPVAREINGFMWHWRFLGDNAYVYHVSTPDGSPISGNVTIPSTITIPSLSKTYTVTELGALFSGQSGLLSVTIPNTVKIIGDDAFRGCSGLKSVDIPSGVERLGERAFYGCSNLASMIIPRSVWVIGTDAFTLSRLSRVFVESGDVSRITRLISGSGRSETLFTCEELSGTWRLTLSANGGSFIVDGGESVEEVNGVEVTIAGSYYTGTIPLPERDNYNFVGWFTDPEEGVAMSVLTMRSQGISKYYAHWEKKALPEFIIVEGLLWRVENLYGNVNITIPDTVREIGIEAFKGCKGIKSVFIPNTVEEIDPSAFEGCPDLKSVVFEWGLTSLKMWTSVFKDCKSLTDVDFSSSRLTEIPMNTFNGCTALKTLHNIPASVQIIDGEAFCGCTSLESVIIPRTVQRVGNFAFADCTNLSYVDIQYGVQFIGNYAFSGCTSLTGVYLPDSALGVGEGAFKDCTSLQEIIFGSGITGISPYTCFRCSALKTVSFGGGLKSIGDSAFWFCSSLKNITFPTSLDEIRKSAFCGCSSLERVELPDCEVGDWAFFDCTSLKSFSIGGVEQPLRMRMTAANRLLGASEGSSKIGSLALFRCSELEDVTLGKSVNSIGGGAFSGCPKLTNFNVDEQNDNYKTENGMILSKDGTTLISSFGNGWSVTVPAGVTSILDNAFAECATLRSVVLPSGVTTIGEAAFSNATAFASITIPASVTTIGANAFFGTEFATANVEKGDTARVRALVEATGYTGTVAYNESGSEPATEWPADTSTVEGQTAAEAYGVTGDLATVDATKLADWAKENNVDFGGSIITDAYLINCANTTASVEAAIETAKEAIKITAISFNEQGEPVLDCLDSYGNGTVVIEGASSLTIPMQWHDKTTGDKFFRTKLVP